MHESPAIPPTPEQQRADRWLLLSLTLSPTAAGINTIVGYTVAHWDVITGYKRSSVLVSAISFLLCAASGVIAWKISREIPAVDESLAFRPRQLFMARLSMMLAALCALVVLAGAFILVTVGPSD